MIQPNKVKMVSTWKTPQRNGMQPLTVKEDTTQEEQYENVIIQMLQLFPMQLTTEFLETASHHLKEKGNHQGEASVLYALGTISLTQNQPEKAIEFFQTALQACKSGIEPDLEAKILLNLGRAYRLKPPVYESVAFSQVETHLQLSAILSQIGTFYAQQNDIAQAIQYLQQVVQITERVREQLKDADAESLQDFENSSIKDYHLLTTLLQRQGKSQEALETLNLLSGNQPSQALEKSQEFQVESPPQQLPNLEEETSNQEPNNHQEVEETKESQEELELQEEPQPLPPQEVQAESEPSEAQPEVEDNGKIHPKQRLRKVIDQAVADKPTAPEFAQRLKEAGVGLAINLSVSKRLNGFSYQIGTRHYEGFRLGNEYTCKALQKRGLRYSILRDADELEPYSLPFSERDSVNPEPVEATPVEESTETAPDSEEVIQSDVESPESQPETDSDKATQPKLKELLPDKAEATAKSKSKTKSQGTSRTNNKKSKSKSSTSSETAKPKPKSSDLPPKQYLQTVIDEAIAEQSTTPQLAQRLEEAGVEVRASVMKNGHMKGLSFRLNGERFYSSDLGHTYSWRSLLERGLSYDPKRDQTELEQYSLAFDRRPGK